MDLTARTVSGAAWAVGGKIGAQAVSLFGMLVAVRILTPKDFGVIAVAALIGELADVFRDFGATSLLVQRKESTESLRSSIFWTTQMFSCAVMGVNWVAAPWVANFYQDQQITWVLRAFSACFLVTSLGAAHGAILQREMRFQTAAKIGLCASLCGNLALIGAAVAGMGVWSVVLGWTLNFAAGTALNWWAVKWRPGMTLAWSEIRGVKSYALNLSGTRLVEFLGRNADNAIIGKFLGLAALGYYQFAYNLLLYSAQSISVMSGRVLFSALAQVQDDDARFRSAYTRSVSVVALITFPLMLGAMAVAEPFVRAIGGTKWVPAIPLVRILAVVGLLQSVTAMTAHIYTARAQTERMFRFGLVTTAAFVISFVVGVRWGMTGVATAYLIANLLLFYPTLSRAFGLIGLKIGEFLRPLCMVFAISCTMAACVWFARPPLAGLMPVVQLVLLVTLGVAVYGGLVWWIRPLPAKLLLRL